MKWSVLLIGILLLMRSEAVQAQQSFQDVLPSRSDSSGVYHPLDQHTPPGTAGRWAAILGRGAPQYLQPIRIELPTQGRVAVYRSPRDPVVLESPAQAGLAIGPMYRLRISQMPEFPGVELYPSVEVLDRLHPPPGKAHEFPVPVEITEEEIEQALAGRLVTKVIYLEQPQLAGLRDLSNAPDVQTVPAHRNLLAEADRLGRPMLILRLGGRLPDVYASNSAFFGTGAPVSVPQPSEVEPQQTPSSPTSSATGRLPLR